MNRPRVTAQHSVDPIDQRVLCSPHAYTTPGIEVSAAFERERFMKKVDVAPGGCWLWNAATQPNGYGRYYSEGKVVFAHRWSYEHFAGPIPDGLVIDHVCRVRRCVNPDHLEPVTNQVNVLRGEGWAPANKAKIRCPGGHLYDVANTYVDAAGQRHCRACRRIREAARRARRKAAADVRAQVEETKGAGGMSDPIRREMED